MAFWLLRKWLDRGGLLAKPPVSEREYTSLMKASKTLFNYPQPGMIVSGMVKCPAPENPGGTSLGHDGERQSQPEAIQLYRSKNFRR